MAFTPNNKLVADPNVTLRDYQHAAKLFNVDQFRLAPKFKFQFHVAFGINTAALKTIDLVQRYGNEINMLVKAVDLPAYTVSTETLNQYNRKKIIQYTHKLNEINIKFHDDNMGLANTLWQNYYSYYYGDPNAANDSGAYMRNATKNFNFVNAAYGLDNNSTDPFFNYIKIYQMARHEFVCYELRNPVITTWSHNKLDYASNTVNDFDMKIGYEAVSYSVGTVSEDSPEGFAVSHYDTDLSPLTGQLNNTTPTILSSNANSTGASSFLESVLKQINTAQNSRDMLGTVQAAQTAPTGSVGCKDLHFLNKD
jgi:hypothetical protein